MIMIRNVLLPAGKSFKKVNVIFNETIQQIGPNVQADESITLEYDFSDCIIIPGAVDMHTHMLQGGKNDAKNLSQYTLSALKGGFTTLAEMPYISDKPLIRTQDLDYYSAIINKHAFCNVALWGQCDYADYPYHLNRIYELWSAGVIGFALTHPSSNHLLEDMSYEDIMGLFDTIYDTDISFAFQGFDGEDNVTASDSNNLLIEKRLIAIRKLLRRLQDSPLHFIGINDKVSIDLLNIAFRRADLTYAFPIAELIPVITRFKQQGYIKDETFSEYVKLLFDSMKNGKLYTLSTEVGHEYKNADPVMKLAYSGYPEHLLQWSVPWVFSELWKNGRASIQSCIRMMCENPAKRIGLFPQKGCIQKGSDADITIIDPNAQVLSDISDESGEKIVLSCAVKAVFLNGELTIPADEKIKPKGTFVKRSGTTRRRSSSSCWN